MIAIKSVDISPKTVTVASPVTVTASFDGVFSWQTIKSSHLDWATVKEIYQNWSFGSDTWQYLKQYAKWDTIKNSFATWRSVAFGGRDMAIQQIRAKVNGTWTVLTLDEATGNYVGTIAAPAITSYNVNSGHYYPVVIEATNKAGTVTTFDETNSVVGDDLKLYVKEVTKPTITITAPTAGAFLDSGVPEITFQVRDEASGSGVDLSSLVLNVDGTEHGSSEMTATQVTNGYNVTYKPSAALTDGAHTITINVSDNDGNAADEVSRTFTTDTVQPTLSITAPSSNDTWVAVASYTVAGTTNDSISGIASVTISVNGTDAGAVTISGNGSFSKAVTLTEGENTIVITATDKAGKITTVTRTINLDTTGVEITNVVINPNPVNVNNSYTITVTAKG